MSMFLYLKFKADFTDKFLVDGNTLTYKEKSYKFQEIYNYKTNFNSFVQDKKQTSCYQLFIDPTGSDKANTMQIALNLKLKELGSTKMPVFISAIKVYQNKYAIDLLETSSFPSKKIYTQTGEFKTKKEKFDHDCKKMDLIDKIFKQRTTNMKKEIETNLSCLIVTLYHNGRRLVYIDPFINSFSNTNNDSMTQFSLDKNLTGPSSSIISNFFFKKNLDKERIIKLMLIIDPICGEDLIKACLENATNFVQEFNLEMNSDTNANSKNDLPSLVPKYSKPPLPFKISSPNALQSRDKRPNSLSPARWKKQRTMDLPSSPIISKVLEDEPSSTPPDIDSSPNRFSSTSFKGIESTSKFQVTYKGKLEVEIEQLKKAKQELISENFRIKLEHQKSLEEKIQLQSSLENLNESYTNLELKLRKFANDKYYKSNQDIHEKLLLAEKNSKELSLSLDNALQDSSENFEKIQELETKLLKTNHQSIPFVNIMGQIYEVREIKLKDVSANIIEDLQREVNINQIKSMEGDKFKIYVIKNEHNSVNCILDNNFVTIISQLKAQHETQVNELMDQTFENVTQFKSSSSSIIRKIEENHALTVEKILQDHQIHIDKIKKKNIQTSDEFKKQINIKDQEISYLKQERDRTLKEKKKLLRQWSNLMKDLVAFQDEQKNINLAVESLKNEVNRGVADNNIHENESVRLNAIIANFEKERDLIKEKIESSRTSLRDKDATLVESKIGEFETLFNTFKNNNKELTLNVHELEIHNLKLKGKLHTQGKVNENLQKGLEEQREINSNLQEVLSSILFEANNSKTIQNEKYLQSVKNSLEKESITKIINQINEEMFDTTKCLEETKENKKSLLKKMNSIAHDKEVLMKELKILKNYNKIHLPTQSNQLHSKPLPHHNNHERFEKLNHFTNLKDTSGIQNTNFEIYKQEKKKNIDANSKDLTDSNMDKLSTINNNHYSDNTVLTKTKDGPINNQSLCKKILGPTNLNTVNLPAMPFKEKPLLGSLPENETKNTII